MDTFTWIAVLCALTVPATIASESDALSISANIQARHMPFGTILDPIYASATSDQITGYTRCGDSALWTGAYLAAESFRYNVTRSAEALRNVRGALTGLKALADVTGDNRLARCMVLAESPFAAGIQNEEAHNTIHTRPPWIWVDNTSRDQVVGAFFGLGVTYDLVDAPDVRSSASALATRLVGFIARHQWSPNDDIASTFVLRPEALQMLLQVARHVNPANTVSGPFFVPPVSTSVFADVQSNSSYFKFNLDYMSLYHLVKLQDNGDNRGAYRTLRNYTFWHQNAFFDLIDRALNGPNTARDAAIRNLLEDWLQRPKRDQYVDLSKTVAVCGGEACQPVPVHLRPPTDFLWQRSPFQLGGGGSGLIESAGVDYILPYWMARYLGVISGTSAQSAPTLLSVNGTGSGVAAAIATITTAANPQLQLTAAVFQCSGNVCTATPIPLSPNTQVYLTLYGTGIRNRTSLASVSATIHAVSVPVLYAGPAPGLSGIDQVNLSVIPSLRGSGESSVVLTVDGQASNAVAISIQ